MSTRPHDTQPAAPLVLQKGKYVFIDELQEVYKEGVSVPFFTARAILISGSDEQLYGDIQTVNVSDLILKQSTYIDETGKNIEAHKLYTWPRNLGSTSQWSAAKHEFLTQYILNFPLEIIAAQDPNGVTWRYITPENFKDFPADTESSVSFKEFASHKNEYFFLRRPVNEPK
jgi:hypothetical protein